MCTAVYLSELDTFFKMLFFSIFQIFWEIRTLGFFEMKLNHHDTPNIRQQKTVLSFCPLTTQLKMRSLPVRSNRAAKMCAWTWLCSVARSRVLQKTRASNYFSTNWRRVHYNLKMHRTSCLSALFSGSRDASAHIPPGLEPWSDDWRWW